MNKKMYTSYEEIDFDIQILNLERDIHYRKLITSLHHTKEHLTPKIFSASSLVNIGSDVIKYLPIQEGLIYLVLKYIFKQKK